MNHDKNTTETPILKRIFAEEQNMSESYLCVGRKNAKSSLEFTKRILDLNISEKEKVEMLKLLFGGND